MSVPKSILLHWDGSEHATTRGRVAAQVADVFDAEIKTLYAATPALLRYPYTLEVGTAIAQVQQLDLDEQAAARARFDQVAAESPRLHWSDGPVEAVWRFARHALYADLVVLGQRDPADIGRDDVPTDFVASVVVDSGCPTLVVPHGWLPAPIGDTVLVAWKETRESMHAFEAAMPWLQRAKQVHIASWEEASPDCVGGLSSVIHRLRLHGVHAVKHYGGTDSTDIGEQLLALATTVRADLLVLGCYGHSRAREWVLGGTSRTVLRASRVPLLMAH